MNKNTVRAKISDFGTSRNAIESVKMTKGVGTPYYMAPEIFDSQVYGKKSDVYALGMTMWRIVTLLEPFEGENLNAVFVMVGEGKRPQLPDKSETILADLIERCWQQVYIYF